MTLLKISSSETLMVFFLLKSPLSSTEFKSIPFFDNNIQNSEYCILFSKGDLLNIILPHHEFSCSTTKVHGSISTEK